MKLAAGTQNEIPTKHVCCIFRVEEKWQNNTILQLIYDTILIFFQNGQGGNGRWKTTSECFGVYCHKGLCFWSIRLHQMHLC